MRCLGIAALLFSSAGLLFADDAANQCAATNDVEEGFVSLFDGRTLDGWQGDVNGYTITDGAMVCEPGGNLYTAKPYANFILRFEFKLPPGGNNGVSLRTPLGSDSPSAYSGLEIQILDDDHPKYKELKPYQFHGSIYGVVAAKRGALKPAGQWNREEIVADGSRIQVTVNGQVVTDVDISNIDKTPDGLEHPGLHNATGYLGWAGHGDPVAFRNIRIKELP